jgi:CxxC-x17-CxxC domain-containing protein
MASLSSFSHLNTLPPLRPPGRIAQILGQHVRTVHEHPQVQVASRYSNVRKQETGRLQPRTREMHDAVCSDCGAKTQVPFKPTEGRPVYCRDCFQKHKPRDRSKPAPSILFLKPFLKRLQARCSLQSFGVARHEPSGWPHRPKWYVHSTALTLSIVRKVF